MHSGLGMPEWNHVIWALQILASVLWLLATIFCWDPRLGHPILNFTMNNPRSVEQLRFGEGQLKPAAQVSQSLA